MAKFYVCKIYRRTGFEERCLLEIMKFSFEVMCLDKLVVFVNEPNQYFFKLLLYVGFRLIKMKPKGSAGKFNRFVVSISKEDFEVTYTKNYKKIIKNKFYNSFLLESYRA